MSRTTLDETDRKFLRDAIAVSQRALLNERNTPFGAIVVVGGEVVGEGTSSVVELHDPTAHAEVMALRDAGAKLGRHLMEDAVMYCSSEPCPMCLTACYWARLPRLVFGATAHDVATMGFEDLQLYRELALPIGRRSLREDPADEPLRTQAIACLQAWADQVPGGVTPKY
jgi:tRNA(Arg) A34 adenosine deaminase TadA